MADVLESSGAVAVDTTWILASSGATAWTSIACICSTQNLATLGPGGSPVDDGLSDRCCKASAFFLAGVVAFRMELLYESTGLVKGSGRSPIVVRSQGAIEDVAVGPMGL